MLIVTPYLLLLIMSLPVVAYLAFMPLESPYPLNSQRPFDAEAIVILGGYVSPPNGHRSYAVPAQDTLSRCLRGAAIFHQGKPCCVVVSGGKVDASRRGPTLAEAMRDFLVSQGVPEQYIVLEDRSQNTYENAKYSADILKDHGFERVVLVTDAASLLRADLCFRKQGMDVFASGCRYHTLRDCPLSVVGFVPSLDAANDVSEAWHEWVGLIWYWLHDRI